MTRRVPDEERLGALLRVLRPVPEGWVQAAQELPGARRSLDEIVARAEADREFRAALAADLGAALEAAGYAPEQRLVAWLEKQLASDPG